MFDNVILYWIGIECCWTILVMRTYILLRHCARETTSTPSITDICCTRFQAVFSLELFIPARFTVVNACETQWSPRSKPNITWHWLYRTGENLLLITDVILGKGNTFKDLIFRLHWGMETFAQETNWMKCECWICIARKCLYTPMDFKKNSENKLILTVSTITATNN